MNYIILEEELLRLLRDSEYLSRLESFGVDNWEAYDMAMEGLDEWEFEKLSQLLSTYDQARSSN